MGEKQAGARDSSINWRKICLRSLLVGAIGLAGTALYPPQLFFEPGLRMMPLAGLNLAMYGGAAVALVAGIGWAVRR